MFNIRTIALATALHGCQHPLFASATPCQPAWSRTTYAVGDQVSATSTMTTPQAYTACTPGEDGCPLNGWKSTGGETTSGTFNFKCAVGPFAYFCGQWDPAGMVGYLVWLSESEACDGTATLTLAPTAALTAPPAWTGTGCPAPYTVGQDYEAESLASVPIPDTAFTMVYLCKPGPTYRWCAMTGFEPGTGTSWEEAWVKLGGCDGTMAPTAAPNYVDIVDVGGCPEGYSYGNEYDEGDRVATDGLVYECKESPMGSHCRQAGYAPGVGSAWADAWKIMGFCKGTIEPTSSPSFVDLVDRGGCPEEYMLNADYDEGDQVASDGLVYECKESPLGLHCPQAGYAPGVGSAWADAWKIVGFCSGTIGPTSSPSFVELPSMGACPDSWEIRTQADPYEEGDVVEANSMVFECKPWPFEGWCSQAGYKPLTNPATPDAWTDAWKLLGYCSGSMGPTASPTFDELGSVGGCPEDWISGTTYLPDDMVSITVSQVPSRKFVYKCTKGSGSRYCGKHAPDVHGGELGWALEGSCDGSIAPTSSPSFDSLAFLSDPSGCPGEFDATSTYKAEDLVSVTVSVSPERKVVYECKTSMGYCNQHDPAAYYGHLGWDAKGACTGSLEPTMSPSAYTGVCEYAKCNTEDPPVCPMVQVEPYSSSVVYVANDVVRYVTQKFTCIVPGWCNQEEYEPDIDDGIWKDAWIMSGVCPAAP